MLGETRTPQKVIKKTMGHSNNMIFMNRELIKIRNFDTFRKHGHRRILKVLDMGFQYLSKAGNGNLVIWYH